ncbi:MAG: CidA/LrgA family protein [Vibrionaceae bacterium]
MMGILSFLRALAILFACLWAAKGVCALLPFAFPPALVGMLLLFMALNFKLIAIEWIEDGVNYLLRHMGVLFIPAAVGVMAWIAPLYQSISVVILCIAVGIVAILLSVGWLFQWLTR